MKRFLAICFLFFLVGCAQQEAPVEEPPVDTQNQEQIVISSPAPNQTITSPLTVSGKARGSWFFEATAPLFVVDWDGRILSQGIIRATDDWMTEDFVDFSGEIDFEIPDDIPYRRGSIIFQKKNPSELSQNDAAIEIPVLFQ